MQNSGQETNFRKESRPDTLRNLTELADAFKASANSEEVLIAAHTYLQGHFSIDALSFGVYLHDDSHVDWTFYIEGQTRIPAAREHIVKGFIQKAVLNREVLIIDDVGGQDYSSTDMGDQHYDRSRSMMIAPVSDEATGTGVIAVKSYGDYSYNDQDAAVLGLVSVMINSQLALFQAEEEKRHLNGQLQALFDNLDSGVALIDEDFNLVYGNKWLVRNLADTVEGNTCFSAVFKLEQPCTGCYLKQLASKPFPGRFVEVTFGERPFSMYLIPLNPGGGKKLFVELIEDRSERELAKTYLNENKRLNSIITFARSIGHELNQPLTGISGYCALLKEEVEKESSVYQDINEIERQAVRLERIVNKFQSVTHLDYKEKK